MALAVLAAGAIHHQMFDSLSSWFNDECVAPVTGQSVVQHLGLIDRFQSGVFDPVLWSLVHEMRVSLVFPVLVLVALVRPSLAIVGTLVATAVVFEVTSTNSPVTEYGATLQYVGCFVAGILVARHRHVLVDRLTRVSSRGRVLLGGVFVLLYTYPWWMPPAVPSAHRPVVDIAAVTVGSAGFLVLAMSAGAFSAALRTSVLQFLGRISYSLYLVHAIVLLAALSLLYNHIPVWVILPMVWTASLALATLSERYIERPSITLGRMLTRRPDYKPVAVGAAD